MKLEAMVVEILVVLVVEMLVVENLGVKVAVKLAEALMLVEEKVKGKEAGLQGPSSEGKEVEQRS